MEANIRLTGWWLVYFDTTKLCSVPGPDLLICTACVSEDLQQPGSYWVLKSLLPSLKNVFQVLTLEFFGLILKYFTKWLSRKIV